MFLLKRGWGIINFYVGFILFDWVLFCLKGWMRWFRVKFFEECFEKGLEKFLE